MRIDLPCCGFKNCRRYFDGNCMKSSEQEKCEYWYLLHEEPERKKGKWIKIPEFCGDDISGFIDNHFSCSECKKEAEINPWGFYILSDFCPNCGVDMREVNNEQLN